MKRIEIKTGSDQVLLEKTPQEINTKKLADEGDESATEQQDRGSKSLLKDRAPLEIPQINDKSNKPEKEKSVSDVDGKIVETGGANGDGVEYLRNNPMVHGEERDSSILKKHSTDQKEKPDDSHFKKYSKEFGASIVKSDELKDYDSHSIEEGDKRIWRKVPDSALESPNEGKDMANNLVKNLVGIKSEYLDTTADKQSSKLIAKNVRKSDNELELSYENEKGASDIDGKNSIEIKTSNLRGRSYESDVSNKADKANLRSGLDVWPKSNGVVDSLEGGQVANEEDDITLRSNNNDNGKSFITKAGSVASADNDENSRTKELETNKHTGGGAYDSNSDAQDQKMIFLDNDTISVEKYNDPKLADNERSSINYHEVENVGDNSSANDVEKTEGVTKSSDEVQHGNDELLNAVPGQMITMEEISDPGAETLRGKTESNEGGIRSASTDSKHVHGLVKDNSSARNPYTDQKSVSDKEVSNQVDKDVSGNFNLLTDSEKSASKELPVFVSDENESGESLRHTIESGKVYENEAEVELHEKSSEGKGTLTIVEAGENEGNDTYHILGTGAGVEDDESNTAKTSAIEKAQQSDISVTPKEGEQGDTSNLFSEKQNVKEENSEVEVNDVTKTKI